MDNWSMKLHELLKQTVESATSQDWLKENNSISHEIWNIEGKFEVERFEYSEKEIQVYARIGTNITSVYGIRRVIYEVLRNIVEDFLVLVPLHTSKEWQFWFITGHESHGHIVRIIIEREKHAHIQDERNK